MKSMLTLTLFGLMLISCTGKSAVSRSSRGASMTYTAGTQADLDAANQRINDYRQELLRQGFHEVSITVNTQTAGTSNVNSKERFVLEGQYRNLKDLRVTLWTTQRLEKDQKDEPQSGGGIDAVIIDNQADTDFEELYKKVSSVVTGYAQ